MGSKGNSRYSNPFILKQAALLSITIICFVAFTIPFFQLLFATANRDKLAYNLEQSDGERDAIQEKLYDTQSGFVMGLQDEQTHQERLENVEALKEKLAHKDSEVRELKEQMAQVKALLSLVHVQQPPQVPTPQPAQAQPAQPSAQPQAAASLQKDDAAKPPKDEKEDFVSTGQKLADLGDKAAAVGDKLVSVLTKILGAVVSFVTGISFAIRWAITGIKPDQKPATPASS